MLTELEDINIPLAKLRGKIRANLNTGGIHAKGLLKHSEKIYLDSLPEMNCDALKKTMEEDLGMWKHALTDIKEKTESIQHEYKEFLEE